MHRFLSQLNEACQTGYELVEKNPIILKRIDINSVMPSAGRIVNDRRIREALQTTIELRKLGALAITDATHQSRKGQTDFYPTLEHSRVMNTILKTDYSAEYEEWEYLFDETCWGVTQLDYLLKGKNILSNNIRFAPWELQTPPNLANTPPIQLVAKLQSKGHQVCYVQDAFPSAHRGGGNKDTSMYALPIFLKHKEISVFPSRQFVDEMQKYAHVNERINRSKKVVVALFGGKVTDYFDVFTLYKRQNNIEFLAGSLLSLVFLKSQNPSLNFGKNEDLFFKDIGNSELERFAKDFDPAQIHLAKDLMLSAPAGAVTQTLSKRMKLRDVVEGIGPQTSEYFADVVKGAQLLIINGCPCNIQRYETYGIHFTNFLRLVRKQNGGLTLYDCGGDAITALEYSGVKADVSSTAGKLGLLAPMIDTKEDLEKYAPAVVPTL